MAKGRSISHHQKQNKSDNGLFDHVPQEVILLILMKINDPQSLLHVSQVSKLFYRLAGHNVLWKAFLDSNKVVISEERLNQDQNAIKNNMIKHPKIYMDSKYFHFLPEKYQLSRVKKALKNLQENDGISEILWREPSITVAFDAQLHQVKKTNTKKEKIKKKFFSFFGIESNDDPKKLDQMVDSIPGLELLNTVLTILHERSRSADLTNDPADERMVCLSFIHGLTKIVSKYGKDAAILTPGSLSKVYDYLKTNPDRYKLFILMLVINHEKLITNPALPKMMDALIARVKNPGRLNIEPEDLQDMIVEDVLAAMQKVDCKPKP